MEEDRDPRPWPYSVGQKGINRVRVYDRFHRGGSSTIQIEWWDDRGRQQRSLKTIVGQPVTDRALARDIAEAMATAQKEKRGGAARYAAGVQKRPTPWTIIEPWEIERG